MTITITRQSPLLNDSIALIEGSEQAMRAVFPPEECFTLSPVELDRPGTHFYVARQGGVSLGCVAAVDKRGYAEVKRLFVTPEGRGQAVARRLMARLEEDAQARGINLVKLETGPALVAAVTLYRALGYRECAAFGGYPDISSNLFMEKILI
ncbi:MAG: GNAT family N-acetyltransferase [Brevirhabdus sp.]